MPPALPRRTFLLSPAHAGGVRARLLLNPAAPFALARRFHQAGLPLAEAFAFMSGLYFRGKIAYAQHFAGSSDLVRVITSNSGLWAPEQLVGPAELAAFGTTEIAADDPGFHGPLRRDAEAMARRLGRGGTVILLGSIATPKYREVLSEVFGSRLVFPVDFVGRGDMSRGALMLHAVRMDAELAYRSVSAEVLTGRRAPRASQTIRKKLQAEKKSPKKEKKHDRKKP